MPRYSPHAVRFELAERLTERIEDALANEPFFDRQPDRAIRVNLDGRLVVLQLHFLGLEQVGERDGLPARVLPHDVVHAREERANVLLLAVLFRPLLELGTEQRAQAVELGLLGLLLLPL